MLFSKTKILWQYLFILLVVLASIGFIACNPSPNNDRAPENPDPDPDPAPETANEMWVANYLGNSLALFNVTDDGDVAPKKLIQDATKATELVKPAGIAIYNQEMYVVTDSMSGVLIFNVTDNGDVAPKRKFEQMGSGIYVYNNEIFIANYTNHTVYVYDINATGSATPKRTIVGTQTLIANPIRVCVDSGEIYVSCAGNNQINVYDINADGDVAPKRTITGVVYPYSCFVSGNELFIAHYSSNFISVYAKTDSGAATPLRILQGANTQIVTPIDLTVINQEIYAPCMTKILVFNQNDSGDTAPKRVISGTNTLLNAAMGITYIPLTKSNVAAVNRVPFAASSDVRGISLTWQDANEHVQSYAIWRSDDGKNYQKITPLSIPANNTTEYSYQDSTVVPSNTTYYYKLECTDKDNQSYFQAAASLQY